MRWQPVSEMTEETRHGHILFLYSLELVDPDFNPEGVVEGFWLDNPDDYPETKGCFIGAIWDNDQDCFDTDELTNITHFMIMKGPNSENT